MKGFAATAAIVLALAGAHSGGDAHATKASGTWVGPLQGSKALVALVSDGDQLVAYVCDDGTIGSWFFAPNGDPGSHRLVGKDGSVLDVTLGDKAQGTFTTKAGEQYSFEAHATDKDVLFRADAVADGTTVLGGWIRPGNGSDARGTLALGTTLQVAPQLNTTVPFDTGQFVLNLAPAPMTPDTLGLSTANTTKFVWGAMGDSFASGEGNPEHGIDDPSNVSNFSGLVWGDDPSIFVPDGFSLRSDVTTCHRSDRAGAPKANDALKADYPGMTFALGFVACSGATVHDLISAGYTGPNVVPDAQLGFIKVPQPAQLARVKTFATSQGQLDALYMSIGGNNAGFGQFIKDCITPFAADCSSDDGLLSQNLSGLAASYNTLDFSIGSTFDPTPPVLISDYPNPLSKTASAPCQGDDYNAFGEVGIGGFDDALKNNVTPAEAIWANTIAGKLNQTVDMAANQNGWIEVMDHTDAFVGHGVCTSQPFANLNSRALRRQGQDVPDTSIFAFSSGFMHPNDAGFAAYGSAIEGQLRPFVDTRAKTGLVAPSNVRIAAATANGAITLRWDDRSTAENADDVEVLPARSQDAALINVPPGATAIAGGGFRARVFGVGAQQFVHQVSGGGRFLYRVRACQTGIAGNADAECGPWSAQVNGTNVLPALPTGLHLVSQTVFVNGHLTLKESFAWNAQPDAIEYVAQVVDTDGTTSETRTSSTSITASPIAGPTYKVSACNRVGCSSFVTL